MAKVWSFWTPCIDNPNMGMDVVPAAVAQELADALERIADQLERVGDDRKDRPFVDDARDALDKASGTPPDNVETK
jgi:hypothetical protein